MRMRCTRCTRSDVCTRRGQGKRELRGGTGRGGWWRDGEGGCGVGRAGLVVTRNARVATPSSASAPASSSSSSSFYHECFAAAFGKDFAGVERVVDSYERAARDETFVDGEQQCSSYVAGLEATPFPDIAGGKYEWLVALEARAAEVQAEFSKVALAGKPVRGNSVWVPAARGEAISYGPDWRTLVLQDRGHWDETNVSLFPKTRKALADCGAPSVEAFFARQAPHTGIAVHTDNTNFIQTAHLALSVPSGRQSRIICAEEERAWEDGKALVCDTSFMHSTANDSDIDRYILIVRFWHPDLTLLECSALQYLLDIIDQPDKAGVKAARARLDKRRRAISGKAGRTIGETATPLVARKRGFGK